MIKSRDANTLVYSLCVLEGYVMSYYVECCDPSTSKRNGLVIPLAHDGFVKAVEFVAREWGEGRTDNLLYNEVVSLLLEVSFLFG